MDNYDSWVGDSYEDKKRSSKMTNEKREWLKVQTNIPETVKFEYQDGRLTNKEYQGKAYQVYMCGIIKDGKKMLVDIPVPAYEELKKKFGDLKDKEIVICKVEEGRSKRWTFATPGATAIDQGIQIAKAAAKEEKMNGTPEQIIEELKKDDYPLGYVESEIMKTIIGVLEHKRDLFGDNFSAVVNTVFMSVKKY